MKRDDDTGELYSRWGAHTDFATYHPPHFEYEDEEPVVELGPKWSAALLIMSVIVFVAVVLEGLLK